MKKQSIDRFAAQVLEVMPFMVREFARREDNDLTQGKISCPQMVALHYTADHGEVKVSEIARILSINKSSASVLLDRLINQKLMNRRHDSKDRRVVWVGITAQGRKVVSQIMGQKRQSIKAIFGPLTVRERDQYLSVLLKVKKHLAASCAVLFILAVLLPTTDAHAFLWFGNAQKKETLQQVTAVETTASGKIPLTLQEAYRRALKRSESVAISAEEIAQAQARFYRAFDYFLPNVHFEMTRFYQDASESGTGFGNSQRPNTPEKKFVFSQPLFSGFKEFAAIQAVGADKKEQVMALKRAKELLFVDVMEAYYTALNTEKDLDVYRNTRQLLTERMKDLDERVQLGRSRESEAKTSLADIKIVESDLVDAEKEARVAKNLLEFYLGEKLADYELVEDNGEAIVTPPDMTAALKRSDVASAEQGYIVAQKEVISAQGDLFPTISVDGNYYTQRVGFQNGNDWDMTLKFDVPVFEVGQTLGDIKEAASNREKARLSFEEKKRLAQLDAENTYEEYASAQESDKALNEARQATKENYEILQKEYSSNLVNNLEVLDALRRYQDIEKRYQEAHYGAKKNYWKLRVALGDIEELVS